MILPAHPQPQSDEILSSWMVRLSIENGWHLHTFYKKIIGYEEMLWNRDLDKYHRPALVDCLTKATGISHDKIAHLSLYSYYGRLIHGNPNAANLRWILPLGIYHRRRRRPGQLFCPICLSEGSTTYYRKHWRLAFYSVCHIHHVVLLDRCPECSSPIEFHRIGFGSKLEPIPEGKLDHCHNCSFNLGGSSTKSTGQLHLGNAKPYLNLLSEFVRAEEVFLGKKIALPLSYYEGLRFIVKMLLHPYSKQFRDAYFRTFGGDADLQIDTGLAFEYQPLETRLTIALMACWLMSNWPENFEFACKEKLLFRTAISDDSTCLPFWLSKVVQTHLSNNTYLYSNEEVLKAISYLRSQNVPLSAKSLGYILGIGRDSALNYLSRLRATTHPHGE